ncbi:peroxisomal (S)-2-hydroxy-acid oxidase GLO5 [Copidosoma floridanum]|uniref:peroxisomal (S)-2-hydroxy-acid oxidase GLO5 n=1 Tax=Copidosoma floridanum TaxID=29053 RepID=UPI0006C9A6C7|nr:peroxisomal (S)-2-hydroxy-acid oxidase GLO5 [Copidosoma floridanum]
MLPQLISYVGIELYHSSSRREASNSPRLYTCSAVSHQVSIRAAKYLPFENPYTMSRPVCLRDFEDLSMKNITPTARDYYKSGAGDEYTLKLNRESFQKLRIRPRVLRNVSKRDISTTILGERVSMPLGVSPTAMQKMAHPDGETANAKATQAANTIFILSTLSTSSIEEVTKAAPEAIKWFQLYVYADRSITLGLIRRAERAGFKALVLTVDTPTFGDRRRDMRNKFSLPQHLRLANFDGLLANKINLSKEGSGLNEYVQDLFDDSLSWKDVDWLKRVTKLPIVLKGILTAEDAILGAEHGASAILVSNHGARQIDGTPSSIEALPEVVKAVGDKVEVYLDGGVTQGTDVFKALALGARMVFIGRPLLWGLTYAGEEGARAVLEIMRHEIDLAFALTGCSRIDQVTRDMVMHESSYSRL